MSRLDGIAKPVDPRKLKACGVGSWIASLDPAELDQLEEWLRDPDVPITQLHEVCATRLGLTLSYHAIGHHLRGRCQCPDGAPLRLDTDQ